MSTVIARPPSLGSFLNPKMDDKRRLVRTTSIEKIKKFNSFICSQQYVVLPALLGWLKCSSSGLQTSTEHTILLFRSIIFNNIIYRSLMLKAKVVETWRNEQFQTFFKKNVVECVMSSVFQMFAKFCDALFLLAIVVYVSLVLVVLQLCFLLFTIYNNVMPSGFLFLLSCIFIINSFFYKTACFFISKNQKGFIE